jgi:hypothetical protein
VPPTFEQKAPWTSEQIAPRLVSSARRCRAPAQQLRAVLESDITDHLHHQTTSLHTPGTPAVSAGALDKQCVAHLARACATVRAYTAAAHSRRPQEAQHVREALPIPARALTVSGPAAAWRRASTTVPT